MRTQDFAHVFCRKTTFWIKRLLCVLILACCLFGEYLQFSGGGIFGEIGGRLQGLINDPETQWIVFLLCFTCFAVSATTLYSMGAERSFSAILLAFGSIVAVSYAWGYPTTAASPSYLMLVAAPALGFAVILLSERSKAFIVLSLVVLLAISAIDSLSISSEYHYLGQERAQGIWRNPNTAGLLMAVGVLLSILNFEPADVRSFFASPRRSGLRILAVVICLASAGLMFRTLLASYARGAWVGFLAGLAYYVVGWTLRKKEEKPSSLKTPRHLAGMAVIAVSAVILLFWQFRFSDWPLLRRLFSMANPNDFSWRNRLAAWNGALQITADYPLSGVGWGQLEPIYNTFYKDARIPEGAAIQLNDFLALGAAAGLPALIGLMFLVWKSVSDDFQCLKSFANASRLRVVCRSALIALLVGFCFDGGLYTLPTASVFWILLLASVSTSARREKEPDSVN